MNENSDSNEPLHSLLREWTLQERLPHSFKAAVWERIARAETRASGSIWSSLGQWLASGWIKPSWAAVYIALLLVLGLIGGYWHATTKLAQEEHRLRTLYVQSVNPYQALSP